MDGKNGELLFKYTMEKSTSKNLQLRRWKRITAFF